MEDQEGNNDKEENTSQENVYNVLSCFDSAELENKLSECIATQRLDLMDLSRKCEENDAVLSQLRTEIVKNQMNLERQSEIHNVELSKRAVLLGSLSACYQLKASTIRSYEAVQFKFTEMKERALRFLDEIDICKEDFKRADMLADSLSTESGITKNRITGLTNWVEARDKDLRQAADAQLKLESELAEIRSKVGFEVDKDKEFQTEWDNMVEEIKTKREELKAVNNRYEKISNAPKRLEKALLLEAETMKLEESFDKKMQMFKETMQEKLCHLEKYKNDLEEFQNRYADVEGLNEKMRQEICETLQTVETIIDENNRLEVDDGSEAKYDEELKTILFKLEQTKLAFVETTSQLQKLEAEALGFEKTLDGLEKQCEEAEAEVEIIRGVAERRNVEIADAEKTKETLDRKLEELILLIDECNEDERAAADLLGKKEGEAGTVEKTVMELDEQFEKLKNEINNMKTSRDAAMKQVEELTKESEFIDSNELEELNGYDTKLKDLKDIVLQIQSQVTAEEIANATLEKELNALPDEDELNKYLVASKKQLKDANYQLNLETSENKQLLIDEDYLDGLLRNLTFERETLKKELREEQIAVNSLHWIDDELVKQKKLISEKEHILELSRMDDTSQRLQQLQEETHRKYEELLQELDLEISKLRDITNARKNGDFENLKRSSNDESEDGRKVCRSISDSIGNGEHRVNNSMANSQPLFSKSRIHPCDEKLPSSPSFSFSKTSKRRLTEDIVRRSDALIQRTKDGLNDWKKKGDNDVKKKPEKIGGRAAKRCYKPPPPNIPFDLPSDGGVSDA